MVEGKNVANFHQVFAGFLPEVLGLNTSTENNVAHPSVQFMINGTSNFENSQNCMSF